MKESPEEAVKREREAELAAALRQEYAPAPAPSGPTTDAYRIAGYADGLIGSAKPDCNILWPRYGSGLKFADKNNPKPDDPLWGGGVSGGVKWDGTFWRDLVRYSAGGNLFWSAYLKPGTGPGSKNGYWLNFGGGWCTSRATTPRRCHRRGPAFYFSRPRASEMVARHRSHAVRHQRHHQRLDRLRQRPRPDRRLHPPLRLRKRRHIDHRTRPVIGGEHAALHFGGRSVAAPLNSKHRENWTRWTAWTLWTVHLVHPVHGVHLSKAWKRSRSRFQALENGGGVA